MKIETSTHYSNIRGLSPFLGKQFVVMLIHDLGLDL